VNVTSDKTLVMKKTADQWLVQQERVQSETVNP
jgi:hypothetical protein